VLVASTEEASEEQWVAYTDSVWGDMLAEGEDSEPSAAAGFLLSALIWVVAASALLLVFAGVAFGFYQDGSLEPLRTNEATVANTAGQVVALALTALAARSRDHLNRGFWLALAAMVSIGTYSVTAQIAQTVVTT